MFVAALFIIAKIWKHSKCSSTNELKNQTGYIHTMQNYSALKINEIQIHATTWKNLENRLSEKSIHKIPHTV